MNAGMRLTVLPVTLLLILVTWLSLACDPEAERSASPTPPAATAALAGASGPALPPAPSPTLAPTVKPTTAAPTTYIVESGDFPSLIAEKVGVPAAEQDAWIAEMLALNNTEATALQIGQELQLPPFSGGAAAASASQTQPAETDTPVSQVAPTATEAVAAATATTVSEVAPTATEAIAVPSATPPAATGCQSFTNQPVRDWCNNPAGDVLNCDDFPTTVEATRFLNEHDPNNVNGLDGNNKDGVACESLG